ncbi:glutamate-5-semialdehyde dehydrogenase [Miniphocaeibacter halophilus]|uniref:Glutamate-5-semialdehyde dehydrogenase n=1 Tax=Miniphocaeibacter halophilus TaxID=2931922 RepID=A0AC61N189_9FIRM|nr:glutamate-5-semialdehyde dehydrogenase [Miniphocaeibacter halophilus]QQK07703.1 glutamate-5-semialdehyde dehydrogenase [Miniphocaeibacter halophilus]
MINEIGRKSKESSFDLSLLSTIDKNNIINKISDNLIKYEEDIISANKIDIENGRKNGLSEGLIDRLLLNKERILGMVDSANKVRDLKDPIGAINHMEVLPNGLQIGKKRIPMGVIGIIYESRPNVTLECSILCLKSSNSLILRGGKEAIESNKAIVKIIRESIKELGFNENFVQLIEDTTRESANALMKLDKCVDLLIPRGSAGLIKSVVQNSTVPVLKTGDGNCHVYVDEYADIDMAIDIIENAKTQRISVCNAMESLLVHKNVSDDFYSKLKKIIDKYSITVYGDEISKFKLGDIEDATDEEYAREYLDYAFSLKVVDSIDEAILHIRKFSTNHSEVIVTKDYDNSNKFLNLVDSACVYVNASSRFTDGFEFGLGAEMGISTQKLHARGPVGLEELTSEKYIILGNGQVR